MKKNNSKIIKNVYFTQEEHKKLKKLNVSAQDIIKNYFNNLKKVLS